MAALAAAVYVVSTTTEPVLGSVLLAVIGTMNALLGAVLALRLRRYELRSNQREHVRLGVNFDATVDDTPARVLDVSLGGALLAVPVSELESLSDAPRLEFAMQGFELAFASRIVRISEYGRGAELALSFESAQDEMMARLGLALLTEADGTRARAIYRESVPVAA